MKKSKVNILLVDDRPEGLLALETVLKDPHYNLVTARSGAEALAAVLNWDFAVILMDVQMPDMDGFETVSLIKQREKSKSIPIIFLTANNKGDRHINLGYSVGAVDYVFKPFDAHVLKAKVSVFVELHEKNILLQKQSEALREVEARERYRILHEFENEERRRYQNLADAIPQTVFRTNERGEIEYFNQFWLTFSSLTLEESVGKGWREIMHREDLSVVDVKWQHAQDTQRGFDFECRLLHAETDVYRWHLLRVVPELNAEGKLVSWIGVATDIHDQKIVQQELVLAKKMAEAANETKSNFLANMSHEIRTPLGVILGFSELLVNSGSTKAEKLDAMAIIRRNGDLLSRIIDEILDLSKVEAGKMEISMAPMAVVDLITGINDFMQLPAQEKGLTLSFTVQGKVPDQIVSDSSRVQQILVNLIGNAIKFTPRGDISVTLSYAPKTVDHSHQLLISVKDSGPGLSREQIGSLFQPFTQVDASITRKHGGTGLGLALSRRLAQVLGGDISIEPSLPGQGCDFRLTIAAGNVVGARLVSSVEPKSPDTKDKNTPDAKSLKGVSVLLVEDSLDNQLLVSRLLKMAGAEVDLANDGQEGFEKASVGNYDVVLMDLQMPVLDGYGAVKKLRKLGFAKPVIALTAHGMIEDRQRCIEVGFSAHLTKPVNRAALIESVRDLAKSESLLQSET